MLRHSRNVLKIAAFLALTICNAICQAVTPKIQIFAPHSPERNGQFDFTIKVYPSPGDSRAATLTLTCTGLVCNPDVVTVQLVSPTTTSFKASPETNVNSGEIDASLQVAGQYVNAVHVLDYGLWNSVSKVDSDLGADWVGGDEKSIHIWLEDNGGIPIKPTSTVHVEVSSSDQCATVKTVETGEDPKAKQFGSTASTIIQPWSQETSAPIWVHPGYWTNSQCSLRVILLTAGAVQKRYVIPLPVKPNLAPAFFACLFGSLFQYLLAGLVQIVVSARSRGSVALADIFVGPNGVEILEALLKGTLAYLLACVLNTTDLVEFKSADKSSLWGFATFAFLIGFWHLKPLWDALRKFSHSDEGSEKESQSVQVEPVR